MMLVSAKCASCGRQLKTITFKLPFDPATTEKIPTVSNCPHCGSRGAFLKDPDKDDEE